MLTKITLNSQTYRVFRRPNGEALVEIWVEPVLTANRAAPGHWRPLRANKPTAKRVVAATAA